jgi:hypothetical protein
MEGPPLLLRCEVPGGRRVVVGRRGGPWRCTRRETESGRSRSLVACPPAHMAAAETEVCWSEESRT